LAEAAGLYKRAPDLLTLFQNTLAMSAAADIDQLRETIEDLQGTLEMRDAAILRLKAKHESEMAAMEKAHADLRRQVHAHVSALQAECKAVHLELEQFRTQPDPPFYSLPAWEDDDDDTPPPRVVTSADPSVRPKIYWVSEGKQRLKILLENEAELVKHVGMVRNLPLARAMTTVKSRITKNKRFLREGLRVKKDFQARIGMTEDELVYVKAPHYAMSDALARQKK
jgi:hypothetical protein